MVHDFKEVRFLNDEGQAMFEVRIGKDGRSIEVRGVEVYNHNGELYTEALEVRPRYSNGVEVRSVRYGSDA